MNEIQTQYDYNQTMLRGPKKHGNKYELSTFARCATNKLDDLIIGSTHKNNLGSVNILTIKKNQN